MELIIKDIKGNVLDLNDVDKLVARLWHKEISKDYYATPSTFQFSNIKHLEGDELNKAEEKYELDNAPYNWLNVIKSHSKNFANGPIDYVELMNNMFNPISVFSMFNPANGPQIHSMKINVDGTLEKMQPYFNMLMQFLNKGFTIYKIGD